MKVSVAITALFGFLAIILLSSCSLTLGADGSKNATLDGEGAAKILVPVFAGK